jgi:glycosyltransferase involved in cell wall biosynthesis
MIKNRFKQLNSILANLFVSRKVKLTHIVETHNWAIQEVGTSITNSLNSQGLIHTRVAYSPIGLRNQIVHFDCVHTLIKSGRIKPIHDSNRIVLTWFHVEPGDPRLKQLAGIQQEISHIHTSCVSTKQTLVQAGICADKIVVIPLGVDTHLFTPAIDDQKNTIRDRLGISHNRLIIGSFQKDGVGWGEGLEPKLIKGPDEKKTIHFCYSRDLLVAM